MTAAGFGQGLQPVHSASDQDKGTSACGPLSGEFGTDTAAGTGDKDACVCHAAKVCRGMKWDKWKV
ncbi:MAG: hypothetical protein OHK005_05540 [Candidatus Methylacidiphilales bacterium]